MGVGSYLIYGILLLIIIPVIMGFIGSAFGEDLSKQTSYETSNPNFLVSVGNWFKGLGTFKIWTFEFDLFNGFFDSLGNMFLGYSLFPWWFNSILVFVPIILIIRGVASVSG
jgi:hypothetical protein